MVDYIDSIFAKDDIHNEFFNKIKYCVFAIDKNGKIFDVNNYFLSNFGYTKNQVVGKNYADFLHKDDIKSSQDVADNNIPQKTFADGLGYFDNRWITKSGEYKTIRWFESDATFFDNYYICWAKIWTI